MESVHRAIETRRRIDSEGSGTALRSGKVDPGLLVRVVRAAPLVADFVRAICALRIHERLSQHVADPRKSRPIPFFRFANWITGNRLPAPLVDVQSAPVDHCAPCGRSRRATRSRRRHPHAAGFREDAVAQNQLTLVTVIEPADVESRRAR